jgi:hypothetical protein
MSKVAPTLLSTFLILAALPSAAAASGYNETLTLQGISFEVSAAENGATSKLTIKPSGLKAVNDPVTHDIAGRVLRAEVADIDSNGDPEIYVFTASNGDPKRGGIIAYAVNKKRSISQIYVPDFTEDPKFAAGYAGGDESAVVETSLVTRFKIANDGKWRQLQYKLMPGEAGWKLVLDKVVEF